jgi:hypothetical protein
MTIYNPLPIYFVGTYDSERVKQGAGTYMWMGPASDDDETLVEKARFEGNYINGVKSGFGKMVYPNGDIFEGEWADDKVRDLVLYTSNRSKLIGTTAIHGQINGEGSYIYKKSGDIYSGSWKDGKKHGEGRYEFQADKSMMVGIWNNGEFKSGKWEFKGAGHYEGTFKLGRPYGQGKYTFVSGLSQLGSYDEIKASAEEEETEENVAPPNVVWRGQSIVAM